MEYKAHQIYINNYQLKVDNIIRNSCFDNRTNQINIKNNWI